MIFLESHFILLLVLFYLFAGHIHVGSSRGMRSFILGDSLDLHLYLLGSCFGCLVDLLER